MYLKAKYDIETQYRVGGEEELEVRRLIQETREKIKRDKDAAEDAAKDAAKDAKDGGEASGSGTGSTAAIAAAAGAAGVDTAGVDTSTAGSTTRTRASSALGKRGNEEVEDEWEDGDDEKDFSVAKKQK